MEVLIQNEQETIRIDDDSIKQKTEKILSDLSCEESELSILFVNDNKIQKLNKEYRGIDRPTDVLSFSMDEGEGGGINPWLLGDVIISLETAARQAEEKGHSLEKEVLILLIHGILHLLGYEHENSPEYAKVMEKKEKEILKDII